MDLAMRFSVLEFNRRALVRSAAIAMVGGLAAGCSSSAMRFSDGVDGIFTASTDNQRNIIRPANQPYPENLQAAPAGSVSRGNLAPAQPGAASVTARPLPPAQQPATTAAIGGSVADMESPARSSVPAAKPKVAEAKPIRQVTPDAPTDKAPLPGRSPSETVAVLPQPPKVKGRDSAATTQAGDAVANAAPDAKGSYTVQEGDTLTAISRKTGVSTAALRSANGMKDGLIRVGQKLTVPTGAAVQTASAKPVAIDAPKTTGSAAPVTKETEQVTGYTPPKKAEKVIEDAEQQAAIAPDSTGIGRMRWPVRGRVVAGYGARSGGKANDGIDISVPEGTSVKAAENGVVIYAGDGLKEFGNTVLVRHEDGLVTVYGHASELKVTRGQKVKRGQEIARSGMSGSADTPKLHFEVRKNSSPVDPSKFLE
jgi:murein DD-endopeptidase MepM/ murein hydrolase activator NlpD